MANSAVVGLLRVLFTANTAEFETAMKRTSDSAKAWSRDLNNISRQAQQVGQSLTKFLTLPLVGVGAASLKASIDFESSFAGVRKTVAATEPEFAALANGMRELAKTMPVNVNELNKIGEAAGQLGIKTSQILDFTEVMAKLGVTTNISATDAAESLAQFANVMDRAKVQAGTFDFDRLGSTIVELGNNFATSESKIVEFGQRIASAGKLAGLAEHQVLAIGTAMASVGVEAEAGGTAVQKVLNQMTEAVATGNKDLETFAKTAKMSAAGFADAFRTDAGAAFAEFVKGLGVQGDKAFTTLDQLKLGNERVIRAFLSLANAGDLLTDALGQAAQAWQSNTALTKEAEERFKTTASQLTMLWNRIRDVGITLGNALQPALAMAIGALNQLIPIIDVLARGFANLPPSVQLTAIGFGAIVAAAAPALIIFASLVNAAKTVIDLFTKTGLASRILAGDFVTLSTVSARANAALALLGKTAAVTAAAFVGWQIGRLIADLTGLDKKIADSITHLTALQKLRAATAEGGESGRLAQIAKAQQDYNDALRGGSLAMALYAGHRLRALKGDQESLAIQDVINKAISQGAEKTITYSQAIEFNRQKIEASKAAYEATSKAVDTTTVSTGKLASASGTLAQAKADLAEANRKYIEETGKLGSVLRFEISNMEKTGLTLKDIAAKYEISEESVKRFAHEMKEATKATNDAEKAKNKAAQAAERYAKEAEKLRNALSKLGIVTKTSVNEALNELAELEMTALAGGAQYNVVLAAMLPLFEDLHRKAVRSGVGIDAAANALKRAQKAVKELTQDVLALLPKLPALSDGLQQSVGQLISLPSLASVNALRLAKAYETFGITTRAELWKTAIQATTAFQVIKDSGTASASEIAAAMEKMQAAVKAAMDASVMGTKGGPGFLERAFGDPKKFGEQLTGVIMQALTGGGNVWRSVGGFIGGEIGKELGATLGKKLGGALGGVIGSALGPIGAALGSVGGGLISGLLDKLFGSRGRQLVESFASQMGGFDELRKKLLPLGDEGERLWRVLTQGVGRNNPKEAEAAIKAVTAALARQEEQTREAREEMSRLAREGGIAGAALLRFRDATRDSAETLAFMRSEALAAAGGIKGFLDSAKVSTQAGAEAMGAVIAGAFGELRAQGASTRDALKELEPVIATLRKQLDETGFSGGEAFNHLAHLAGIAANEISGPALSAIHGLSRALEGAHNAGFLTQQMFSGLVGEIHNQRQAILNTGASFQDVNSLMQRELQTIWQLQKDFNFQVDDATQALLEEAEAAGTVGDQYRSAMDRAARAMERVADALETIIGKAKGLGQELDRLPSRIQIGVGFDVEDRPSFEGARQPEFAATGGLVTNRGITPAQRLAVGGVVKDLAGPFLPRGTDTQPAMLTPGEIVLTEAQQGRIGDTLRASLALLERGVQGAGIASLGGAEAAPGGTQLYAPVTVTIQGDVNPGTARNMAREIARQVAVEIPKVIRHGGEALDAWKRDAIPALGLLK